MNRIRAFIALNLPIETVEQVAELQAELRSAAAAAELRVAWVPPPNMHVTLRFLGEIPEEAATAIGDTLERNLARWPALPVIVRGVGAFPEQSKPRVIWLGVDDADGAVVKLASEVNGWLDDLGFAPDKREIQPHLTLGRVKQGDGDIVSPFADREIGSCVASEVAFYRSVLQRKGAEYEALRRVVLSAAGPEVDQ